ncbi:MAG TPA: cellulose synthase operon protein YhjQ/BcsQ [Terriglobales bacterium]|nr:cellulose synthase operon protein YhjQ/BcsQ [Terriglobales bacterium]
MRTFRVALVGKQEDHLSQLKSRVEATLAAEVVFRRDSLPAVAADSSVRQLQQMHPDVVLVDIANNDPDSGITAIEILTKESLAVFAVGALSQPQVIIRAMRAGASEFLDRDLASGTLLEAFARLHASMQGKKSGGTRGKLITIMSAKGGCGATTIAVNAAVALQKQSSHVALVDLAPLGHASLHLNVRPQFGLVDALRNLHRMDASLLEGFMTELSGGLRLLAGLSIPAPLEVETSDLVLLFDLLLDHYKYVVVDASNRMDKVSHTVSDLSELVLLVVQADVSSLWSAGRVREFLGGDPASSRVQLLVNRYRKIAGFSDEDAQAATNCRIFWKIPNQFNAVGPAIDRGNPVALQNNSEIARSFNELADAVAKLKLSHVAKPEITDNRRKEQTQRALDRLISLSTAPSR